MKLIPLTQGQFAQVDDEHYEWLMQWKWYAAKSKYTFYAVMEQNGHPVKMHRVILGLERGDTRVADHKDKNGLNNTSENLRACTMYENNVNSRKKKTDKSTSRYKGVSLKRNQYFDTKTQTFLFRKTYYRAHIAVSGKTISLGYHKTELSAAKAYNEGAKKHHGEFAGINILYCNPCVTNNNLITKYQ